VRIGGLADGTVAADGGDSMEVPEPRTVRWMGDEDMGIFYGGLRKGAKLTTEGTEGRRGTETASKKLHQQRTRRAQKKERRTEVISWFGVGLGLGHLAARPG